MLLSAPADGTTGAGLPPASPWVQRWTHLIRPGARVLDIACGSGRHMAWLAERGLQLTGIDRSAEALRTAARYGNVIEADLENQPWPLLHDGVPQTFDVVLVTNYLWRALWTPMLQSLAPGGLLIYETFAQGNERFGKPSSPQFLLRPGELIALCDGLHIVAFEQGLLQRPTRCVQRIVAQAPAPQTPGNTQAPTEALWLE